MSQPIGPSQGQYQIVAELLERQNDVLDQIDHLNDRIEKFIVEISHDRRSERERQDQIDTHDGFDSGDPADLEEAA